MKQFILITSLFLSFLFNIPAFALEINEMQKIFNSVASKASQSVVSVQVVREEAQKVMEPEYFFGYIIPQERVYTHRTAGLGSGVIIDPRGYVLTNLHVVEDAVLIKVTTQDENGVEKTWLANPVASDPALDLALLKIKEQHTFPYLTLNADDKLKVGNIVVAVGYPFGFKQTVTSGIISALNAKLPVEGRYYENLIQTDAAINQGNSGGPLLNMNCEVIGINTAIASPNGAFAGMGFSVPSSSIKPVLEDMLAGRKIKRGWLGVTVLNIDRIMAARLGYMDIEGVIVNQSVKNSPAWKAGIRRGDIILSVGGTKINSDKALLMQTFSRRPGEEIIMEWLQSGKRKVSKIILADRDTSLSEYTSKGNITEETILWEKVELVYDDNGARIVSIDMNSKLNGYLLRDDIITAVNGKEINNFNDMKKCFDSAKLYDGVVFDLTRNGEQTYISVQDRG